jgi:hypothetical protein
MRGRERITNQNISCFSYPFLFRTFRTPFVFRTFRTPFVFRTFRTPFVFRTFRTPFVFRTLMYCEYQSPRSSLQDRAL